ncbi:uncharacterized protein LOC106772594 [Vigna radiata var. radiata]|uniref:Uncharacterized protein LOC106772594 n=1 Tax=Vigna radiata var. radiata TaxID=3916 RepID=A0A1S3V8V5_VIGRR|nr:uncharacterized protein LOC106772594 [Vigna radiata var. radiata]
MASLTTHLSGFIIFFPIGIRRLVSSTSLYLHNPSHFRSKLWYFSDPKWKTLDLYAVLIALPVFSFTEFFLFFSFSGHPVYKFSFFQQSLAVLAFWLLTILIIVRERVGGTSLVDEGFVFLSGGIVFLLEYSVMEKGVSGLAGSVYGYLGGLTLAGFSLYTDLFGLKGCRKINFLESQKQLVDVHCDLDEDSLRGVTLMNFLFTVHAIGVVVLAFGAFGVVAGNRSLKSGEAKGPLLSESESSSFRTLALPDLEME